MTTPTPSSSSPAPNTVIGYNPLGEPIHDTLAAAVRGHAEIVAAIVNHAELGALKRSILREVADSAHVSRGEVGRPAELPAGAPAE